MLTADRIAKFLRLLILTVFGKKNFLMFLTNFAYIGAPLILQFLLQESFLILKCIMLKTKHVNIILLWIFLILLGTFTANVSRMIDSSNNYPPPMIAFN